MSSDKNQRPRVLCVGHALKESLSVADSRRALMEGIASAGGEVVAGICISDGGDGFLDAIAEMLPLQRVLSNATGPLGDELDTDFLFDTQSACAFIEIARCSGLQLVPLDRRNIMGSGTAGVGDLIAAALKGGASRILVGLGGSATCDGGVGLVARLAERLLDLAPGRQQTAGDLPAKFVSRTLPRLRVALKQVELVGCTDVTSPLTGPEGSAALFAPQKGATPEQVQLLDNLLSAWADNTHTFLGEDLRWIPGAGAAGGLGFAILALGGRLRPGADELCDLAKFDDLLAYADAVICSEGRFDRTSLQGKAPWKVAQRARAAGRAAAIACGSADPSAAAEAASHGITIVPFAEQYPPAERPAHAARLLTDAARQFVLQWQSVDPSIKSRHQGTAADGT